MASICDFTASDGTVSREQAVDGIIAYNEGDLSRVAAVELVSAYNDGSAISRCGDGSGPQLGVDPNLVSITSCTIASPSDISAGETATITAELANGNSEAVRTTIRFRSSAVSVAETVPVAAGRTTTVSVDIQFDEPGEYQFDAVKNAVVPL